MQLGDLNVLVGANRSCRAALRTERVVASRSLLHEASLDLVTTVLDYYGFR